MTNIVLWPVWKLVDAVILAIGAVLLFCFYIVMLVVVVIGTGLCI